MGSITFSLHRKNGVIPLQMEVTRLFAIGYAGRNTEKTLAHIHELERDLGVPAPQKIPTIFECSNLLLSQENTLQFVGSRTCGEVEYVMLICDGKLYIGVGSDHTDRELEAQSVLKAKQVCPKPIGLDVWDYDEIKEHWDQIGVISCQTVDGVEIPYQSGTLADILSPETILSELKARIGPLNDCAIFSGTVPTLAGFRYGSTFRCSLVDETLSRSISCCYRIVPITEEER